MKRPGPELKMPELKVPAVLADLYYDLRDRRLLPLVAFVLAAIVAVPFLLGSEAEEEVPPSQSGGASVSRAAGESLTVVEAKPGLRDYRKRLDNRTPTDPFEQRYTGSGGQLNSPTTETSTGKTDDSTTTTTTTGSGAPADSPTGGAARPGDVVLFAVGINVKITRFGGKDAEPGAKPEPIVKKDVLPQTPLPYEKAPVVTYMGLSKESKGDRPKVLLLVAPEVKSVFGDARCVSGDETCQMLEVEPGFPEEFIYGENEVHYLVNVLKVGIVVLDRK